MSCRHERQQLQGWGLGAQFPWSALITLLRQGERMNKLVRGHQYLPSSAASQSGECWSESVLPFVSLCALWVSGDCLKQGNRLYCLKQLHLQDICSEMIYKSNIGQLFIEYLPYRYFSLDCWIFETFGCCFSKVYKLIKHIQSCSKFGDWWFGCSDHAD